MKDKLAEFSRYYKRIAYLELNLKDRLYSKYSLSYSNNCYRILLPYFKNLEISTQKYKNMFTALELKQLPESTKLRKAFSALYFSDVIQLLDNRIFTKSAAKDNFFKINCKSNINKFRQYSSNIVSFRNAISHFNFDNYGKHKHSFINSLKFFEQALGLEFFGFDIHKFNNQGKLPSRKAILRHIFKENPNIFSEDKKLIDIFDEIALDNGYTIQGLPSRASVIRAKFAIQAKAKTIENEKLKAVSATQNK